jgi:hypothetical protein
MNNDDIKYIDDRLSYIENIITNYQLDNLLLESLQNEINELKELIIKK